MRYHLSDIPFLLRTSAGRRQIIQGLRHRSLPVLARLAALHRRVFARRTRVIAVVGSFGKTTTTRATAVALNLPLDPRLSANALSSVALTMLRTGPWQRYSVIEAGIDNVGQMDTFSRMIRPDIAIVTSIGSEHHRSLKTLEVTRAEKARMIAAMPEESLAVLGGDDPHVRWMKTQTRARVVTFGLDEGNDVRATGIELDWPGGTRFRLHVAGETHAATVRLVGPYMVYPILAAVAVARAEGRALGPLLASLARLPPTPGRMCPIALPNGAWLLDDAFKSTLETVHAALDVFSRIPASRRLVVMGEVSEPPGSQGPIYREIGRRIAGMADVAVFLGSNFQRYAAGARRAGMASSDLRDAGRSARKAAEILRDEIRPGDVALIKGRDTQRLERIVLSLLGRSVGCDVDACHVKVLPCGDCPMLEKGWTPGRRLHVP